jgi:tight adherence protein B
VRSNWIFISLVFVSTFLLVWGFVVPVFGESRNMRKRLLARLDTVAAANAQAAYASLLREKYLGKLSPLERSFEAVPGMERLTKLIEQSGKSTPAYRVVLLSVALAAAGGICGWMASRTWQVSVTAAVVALLLPIAKILRDRVRRMAQFDEQLPEALDVIKRALKAGHPFSQCLKLVAEDMDEPINAEFEKVFSEINYGSDVRSAMLGLLERVPNLSVMALVTVVMIQKETGGNLAETLERITAVIRGRFKLQRRVRTLSAEGRMSAWILAVIPVLLFAAISITQPEYMPMLVKDPRGPNLIMGAATLGIIGIIWLRRIIKIEV